MKITQDVSKGKLQSAYVEAPFDKAKETLEKAGYRIISAEENAGLRVQEGAESGISQNGNWTREGFIYVPKKGIFLTKNSPIMENPTEATNANRQGELYFLNDSQVESSLVNAVKVSKTEIPTNRFADEEITSYLFGKNAKQYGQFLKGQGIDEMPIWLANLQDKPFATQLWLHGIDLGLRSGLNGNIRYLYFDSRMRGVRDGKADAKKIGESYTPAQIKRALEKAKLGKGIEKLIFEGLKQKL